MLNKRQSERRGEQLRDIMLTTAFTLGPFGFGVPIKYACACWIFAWAAGLHLLWNLEYVARLERRTKVVVVIVSTAIGFYLSYPPIRKAYTREQARATSGELIAEDDGRDHTHDLPALQMGPDGTKLTWTGPSDQPMLALYYDKIKLRMMNGRVLLSTTVRDDNKNLIAEIIDNHWIVSSSTASCWDKNYTDDSLEVKDGHGRVVLQVRVLPNIVQLQEEWQWNPGTKSGGIYVRGHYSEKDGITPLFKYPSELYWGELLTTQP
jgi:hypothetical protein